MSAKSSSKLFFIMHEDTVVLEVNFDEGIFKINREDLLPFSLKGKLKQALPDKEMYSKYELSQAQAISSNNRGAVIDWLAGRTLSLGRYNAKWIYNAYNINQIRNSHTILEFVEISKALSVLDNYWIKPENDEISWAEVNLHKNHLDKNIADMALHGSSVLLDKNIITPEISTSGSFPKAWRRHEDGSLWLHKAGIGNNSTSEIEVMCSNLLDKINVEHCHYEVGQDGEKYVCMCPCMTKDNLSILSGLEFGKYCETNGLDYQEEMLRLDARSIYKMWIVDYLISNGDRHGENWGFYYDPHSMQIQGCHPLFDHNKAFDEKIMNNPDASSQFGKMTMRQAAEMAIKRVDLHFTDQITRADFLTEHQFKSFYERSRELGIE